VSFTMEVSLPIFNVWNLILNKSTYVNIENQH
jgi:hypothetical protein